MLDSPGSAAWSWRIFSPRRSHPPYWSFAWRLSRADALRAQVWRQSVPPVIPPGWRAVAVPAVFRPQRHLPGRRSFRQAVHGWLRIFPPKRPGHLHSVPRRKWPAAFFPATPPVRTGRGPRRFPVRGRLLPSRRAGRLSFPCWSGERPAPEQRRVFPRGSG